MVERGGTERALCTCDTLSRSFVRVTRDGIELRYVTKLRTRVHVSNVIRDDNDISMMTRLETYESVLLEF